MKIQSCVWILISCLIFPVVLAADELTPPPASPRETVELWSLTGMSYAHHSLLPLNFQTTTPENSGNRSDAFGLSLGIQGFSRESGWGFFMNNSYLLSVMEPDKGILHLHLSGGPMYSFYLAPEADAYLGAGLGMTIAGLSRTDDSSVNLGFVLDGGFRYGFYNPRTNRRTVAVTIGTTAHMSTVTIAEGGSGSSSVSTKPTFFVMPYISFSLNFDESPWMFAYLSNRSIEINL